MSKLKEEKKKLNVVLYDETWHSIFGPFAGMWRLEVPKKKFKNKNISLTK